MSEAKLQLKMMVHEIASKMTFELHFASIKKQKCVMKPIVKPLYETSLCPE